MVTLADYAGPKTTWCPGCGDFGVLSAVKTALVKLELAPWQVCLVSGIGQAGKLPHYMQCNCFNGLHGRTLPVATGLKLSNHDLVVIAVGGDGDGYAEGGNHFVHAAHRNLDITYILHNNQIYGLTKGQASPTSDEGFKTRTTPEGAIPRLNGLGIALAAEATFIARGFSQEAPYLAGLIAQGIQHRGFAFIEVLQPCVTFNHVNTYAWYKQRVYHLDEDPTYDPTDRDQAWRRTLEWGDRIPTGVFYRSQRPTLEDKYPALQAGPLVRQPIDPMKAAALVPEYQ